MKIKPLSINPNYKIYSDGRIWSLLRGKFLKPSKHSESKPNYFQYDIFNVITGKYEKHSMERLRVFHFEKHGFSNIQDMRWVPVCRNFQKLFS